MKKFILFVILCMPAALIAQNGVTVSNLVVSGGTVTFNVQWTDDHALDFVWSDTVWVFVDYNNNGKMVRLPVTGATASAGTVTKISSNDKGVWVEGNARTQGSFSATVQLLTTIKEVGGACAYASNYPPVGKYTSATDISFTGTPQYTILLKNSGGGTETRTGDSPFTVPADYTVQSFTDKTGAPGKLSCMPMTGSIDFTAPTNVPKGLATSFEVLQQNLSIPNASAITYTWLASNFNPSSGTGILYAPTAPAATGTYPVTLTARSTGYCDKAVTQQVNVIDCISSATYDLKVSATAYCTGSSVTFALSNTTLGRTYRLYKDGGAVMNALSGTDGAATFTGAFAGAGTYTAQVIAEGGNCAAVMAGAHNVNENPLPTNLSLTANPATICTGQSATLTAVATGAASYSIDNSAWQTTTLFKVSPTSNQSYTLFVRTAAGCSATKTNAAAVAVNAIPTVPTMSGGGTQCGGTRSITASYGNGGNGIRWTDDNSTTATRSVSVTGTYYAVTTSANGCESAAASVSVTINTAPTITRSGGNASQTVNQNAAITTITYTASNASGISRSGSTFPTGLNGTTAGLVHTISGAPSSASTYSYTVTTTNNGGCTNATASGTITVVPQYAASTKTWVYGSQTWSDAIRIPTCNTNNFTISNTSAYCRSYTSGTNTWYYYNWTYVNQNASTMCSAPWRVPSASDFNTLINAANYTTVTTDWGYGGYVGGGNTMANVDGQFNYWTTNSNVACDAWGNQWRTYVIDNYFGHQVRCVK